MRRITHNKEGRTERRAALPAKIVRGSGIEQGSEPHLASPLIHKKQKITSFHIISPHYTHTKICTGLYQRRGKDPTRTHMIQSPRRVPQYPGRVEQEEGEGIGEKV